MERSSSPCSQNEDTLQPYDPFPKLSEEEKQCLALVLIKQEVGAVVRACHVCHSHILPLHLFLWKAYQHMVLCSSGGICTCFVYVQFYVIQ